LAAFLTSSTAQAADLKVSTVAAGDMHSLFLTDDGRLWAMGDNDYGQLGDGTYTTRNTPVLVNGGTNVIAMAAGSEWIAEGTEGHSLYVTSDGKLWAMGANYYGQLGIGATGGVCY